MARQHSTCKHCGIDYIPKEANRTTFCSRECAYAYKAEANPKFCTVYAKYCAICNKPFIKRTNVSTCSKECRSEFYRYKAKNSYVSVAIKENRKCAFCSNSFITNNNSQIYCSISCSNGARRRKVGHKYRDKARHYQVEYEVVNRIKVFERDGWRCQICGKRTPQNRQGQLTSNAPELDHRIPLSKGGGHTYENTQCACRACNGAKSNKAVTGQMPLLGHRGTGG